MFKVANKKKNDGKVSWEDYANFQSLLLKPDAEFDVGALNRQPLRSGSSPFSSSAGKHRSRRLLSATLTSTRVVPSRLKSSSACSVRAWVPRPFPSTLTPLGSSSTSARLEVTTFSGTSEHLLLGLAVEWAREWC